MRLVPLGRVMCLIVNMLCNNNMCNSLSGSSEFRCGISVMACARHSLSNFVICIWKFLLVLLSLVLLSCIPPTFLRRNNVWVVGDLMQSFCFICRISAAPPYLASMWCMSPLYIVPSMSRSFSAFLSCSPMHLK